MVQHLVAAVGVMALRAVLSLDARFPRVLADEAAYLGMARLLARGERWDLGLASTYGFAYSVLIAPWFALGLSPDAVYRAAIATNVVLAGLTFLAFAALARRAPGVSRPLAVGLAAVAASLPALVTTTRFAWSDDLAPLAFAVLVGALLRAVDEPTTLRVAALVAVAAAGYSVHGRFLPLAPVVAATLVALVLGGRLRWPVAAAGIAALGAGLVAVQAVSDALTRRLYDPMQVTQGLNQVDRAGRPGPLLLAVLGQGWYLLATTAGLAGLGAAAVGARWWRATTPARARRTPTRERLVALARPDALALTATIGLVLAGFAASVVFMTDRPRGDHQVYGRYNDLFVGPLVVWGGAFLVTARSAVARMRRVRTAGAVVLVMGLSAVLVATTRRDQLEAGYLVFPVLGLAALDPDGPAAIIAATQVAVVLSAVLVAAGVLVPTPPRARPVAAVVVALVLCVVGSVRAADRLDRTDVADPGEAEVMATAVEPGARVAWVSDDDDNPIAASFFADQLYLPDSRSVRTIGAPWEAGEPYVVAGARRPEPAAAGYRLAWVEPGSSLGLWVAPGPRQDALAAEGRLLAPGIVGSTAGDDGTVAFTTDPSVADGPLRGEVAISRPTDVPWATVGPGGETSGRVRLLVTVEGRACRCPVTSVRVDLRRWVAADDETVAVDLDVALSADAPEDLDVTVELLREGVARFGTAARAATG